ncbi:MAG TPA: sugar phosphate isomerase/epimerase family protein [Candidatus Paceibacterota bacterium]|nr:sugar phosphate isomerase/epimerase family protein [Candidatus Paceibacterota bacterium]
MSRRSAIQKVAGTSVAAVAAASLAQRLCAAEAAVETKLKGRINHSVCKWCYDKIPLEDFCRAAKDIGLSSIELLEVKDFPTLKKHGLTCAVVTGVPGMITSGLNRIENHDKILEFMERTIPAAAEFGAPNVICFSGNRKGLDDEKGLENCATGLKRIMPLAEKHKVTVIMELLNSKRNHEDYQCDHTAWGVDLVKRVGSENFKLLYDIFHMQIMEGDVCDTIRENHQYIAHYHTGGVPGRAEIDDSQELNYPRIMKAILDTGFKGYVAQEFVPKRPDALASLRQGVEICDI